jgi:SAM-dependent methyltransferase
MDFSSRSAGPEILDSEDVGPDVFARVMDDLASVSRVMMAHGPTLGFLHRATKTLPRGTTISILDVGCGEGDLLRRIRRWSNARGLDARLCGLDLNPRSATAARAKTPPAMAIEYITGDIFHFERSPDFVVSSLFTHHLTDADVIRFLHWMDRHAQRGWFINDLERHAVAYHGFGPIARLARWHPIVRKDGQMSVARSFTPGEWQELLRRAAIEACVRRKPMYRICVEAIR